MKMGSASAANTICIKCGGFTKGKRCEECQKGYFRTSQDRLEDSCRKWALGPVLPAHASLAFSESLFLFHAGAIVMVTALTVSQWVVIIATARTTQNQPTATEVTPRNRKSVTSLRWAPCYLNSLPWKGLPLGAYLLLFSVTSAWRISWGHRQRAISATARWQWIEITALIPPRRWTATVIQNLFVKVARCSLLCSRSTWMWISALY